MKGYVVELLLVLVLSLCIFSTQKDMTVSTPIVQMTLDTPKLKEVAKILNDGLMSYFRSVEVRVVNCPDLREKPFSLAGEGLNGSPTLVEVGGENFLNPEPDKTKVYDFKDIHDQTGVNPAFVLGAGAGPFLFVGSSSELIANLVVMNGLAHSKSQTARVLDDGQLVTATIPNNVTTYAFLANYFVSEGKPGPVLQIKCSKRLGSENFPEAVRKCLIQGFPEKTLGVGGTFMISKSKVYQHAQPNFSNVPLDTQEKVNNWLKFFNMNPPLIAMGTLVTSDPQSLSLRPFHFHSLSDHGEAGHYHYDLDPDEVEYLAYFNLATSLRRVDKPT